MSIEQALAFTFKKEGGLANVLGDHGGTTKYGISKRAYPELDILNLTLEQATVIYTNDYWLKSGCDRLPLKLAIAHFDFAVHSGPITAIKVLQRVIQATPDGILGAETLGKINQWKLDDLINRYLTARLIYMDEDTDKDPTQKQFRSGWYDRVIELRAYLETIK
jgi:lysozyme family protein